MLAPLLVALAGLVAGFMLCLLLVRRPFMDRTRREVQHLNRIVDAIGREHARNEAQARVQAVATRYRRIGK